MRIILKTLILILAINRDVVRWFPILSSPSLFASTAKYFDQPRLLSGLQRSTKWMLPLAGAGYVAYDTFNALDGEKKKRAIKDTAVVAGTVAAALYSVRKPDGAKLSQLGREAFTFLESKAGSLPKVLEDSLDLLKPDATSKVRLQKLLRKHHVRIPGKGDSLSQILLKATTKEGVSPLELQTFRVGVLKKYLGSKTFSGKASKTWQGLKNLLTESESRLLSPKELKAARVALSALEPKVERAESLFNMLIPKPENLTGKEILSEIWELSKMGLMPVVGGLAGGAVGNALTGENVKERFSDEAKEGFFQYFANIMLCNVGAGAALLGVERIPSLKNSRPARLGAMVVGVASFGVLGGSAIANFFSKNLINPMFDDGVGPAFRQLGTNIKEGHWSEMTADLYSERHPEALDVGLHVDDFATVGMLSGLKWIEPMLPALYSISGVRTGQGYRNSFASNEGAELVAPKPLDEADQVSVKPNMIESESTFEQPFLKTPSESMSPLPITPKRVLNFKLTEREKLKVTEEPDRSVGCPPLFAKNTAFQAFYHAQPHHTH